MKLLFELFLNINFSCPIVAYNVKKLIHDMDFTLLWLLRFFRESIMLDC